MQHISPSVGVAPCGAKSPAACKFKSARHFSEEAAERIKNGTPSNYYETEAMHEHNAIQQRIRLEGKGKPVPKPSPGPSLTAHQSNRFPQNHRKQQGARPTAMSEVVYHRDIGFPPEFAGKAPSGKKTLEWSRHAEEARFNDRYGDIPHLKSFNPEQWNLLEVGVEPDENGKTKRITKFTYRTELDDDHDMCIVVIPKGGIDPRTGKPRSWFVKTVWLNESNDAHRTLDRSKYATPVKS